MVAARVEHRRGQDWIGSELGLAPRTVSRILRRHGLPRLAVCDPMTGEVIRASRATPVRYERAQPGELVHMDVKKIGRIPDGGGWRAHGRQMGKTSVQKKARIGFDYVHSVVDDHTRYAYSEILADEKAATTATFFERALQHFAARGIAVGAVMTDNHWTYTRSNQLAATLERIGADHPEAFPFQLLDDQPEQLVVAVAPQAEPGQDLHAAAIDEGATPAEARRRSGRAAWSVRGRRCATCRPCGPGSARPGPGRGRSGADRRPSVRCLRVASVQGAPARSTCGRTVSPA